MAVENPPHPAPVANAINPRLSIAKDVAILISGLGGFSAVLIAAIALVFSMTIAPLRNDLQVIRQEMKHGFEAVDADFEAVDAEFKAVRQEMKRGFEAVDVDFEAVDAEFKAVRQEMQRDFKEMDAEFKAVRKDLADLSERLVRLETLLEQGADPSQTPVTPTP